MTISKWLEENLINGSVKETQIIVIYNNNNNIEYLGKAGFAPVALWMEFKRAEVVGNELRINERKVEETNLSNEEVNFDSDEMEEFYRNCKETEISTVIVGGKFKNVVFASYKETYYIVVGDNNLYNKTCGMRPLASIDNWQWYKTTKEEGNKIFKAIIATKKISKKGNVYYTYNF